VSRPVHRTGTKRESLTEDIQHFEPAAVTATDPGKLRYLLVSLAVVVLDQWTKWLVEV
jgi:hypothetical protein